MNADKRYFLAKGDAVGLLIVYMIDLTYEQACEQRHTLAQRKEWVTILHNVTSRPLLIGDRVYPTFSDPESKKIGG